MCPTSKHQRRPAGFTLVELLVGVAIIGVLSAFAVPAFNNFMVNERVKNAAFDVTSSLIVARSEAIKRNVTVTVTSPNGTVWTGGWDVTAAADPTKIVEQAAYPSSSITITGDAASVSYNRSGRAGSAFTIVVAPATASSVSARCISISLTGLPKSVLGSTC